MWVLLQISQLTNLQIKVVHVSIDLFKIFFFIIEEGIQIPYEGDNIAKPKDMIVICSWIIIFV
jgi:hypothetical protein